MESGSLSFNKLVFLCFVQNLYRKSCYSLFQIIYSSAFCLLWSWKSILLNSEKNILNPYIITKVRCKFGVLGGVFQELKNNCYQLKNLEMRLKMLHLNIHTGEKGRYFMKIWQIQHAETPYLHRTLVIMQGSGIFFSEFKNIDFQLHNKRNAAE